MTNNDSWDKLLSDFGIEKPAENRTDNKFDEQFVEKAAEPPKKPVSAAAVEVREEQTENTAEENSSEEKVKSKKSFFSRFPKINIFGSAPTESLDAIAEGVKSPSLGGKPFTGKTIEKSPGYVEKKTKKREEFAEETAPQETDGWSVVASQISVIASGDAPKTSRGEHRPYKPASIFEDEVPKSEEFLALQDLLEDSESPSRTDSRQKREPVSRGRSNRNDFDRNRDDEEERTGEKYERYGRGRGRVAEPPVPVDDDDFENSVWQEVDDTDSPAIEEPRRNGRENPARENTGGRNDRRERTPRDTRGERTQGRGQRNAVLHDIPKSGGENEFQKNEPRREERPQRGGSRSRRYAENKPDYNKPDYEPRDFERQDNKPEQNYRQKRDYEPEQDYPEQDYEENTDGNAAESSAQLHRNMPGWEDAVGDIIAGNIVRHRNSPPYRSGKR